MLHFVMRTTERWQEDKVRKSESEPLALVKINAREHGNMTIGMPRHTRFGPAAPVTRNGLHVYNLMVGDNDNVYEALVGMGGWRLEEITEAEWETWAEMGLFPVIKTAVAR